jgi:hypothetical protein
LSGKYYHKHTSSVSLSDLIMAQLRSKRAHAHPKA